MLTTNDTVLGSYFFLAIVFASCAGEPTVDDAGVARGGNGSAGAPTADAEVTGDAGDASAPEDVTWSGLVPEVCDGSNRVRLAYRILSAPGRSPTGAEPIERNGVNYWLVTGTCEYYSLVNYRVRHGTLQQQEAQDLGRRVHFGRFTASAGYRPRETVFDASSVVLWLDGNEVRCYASCKDAPPEVQDAQAQADKLLYELTAQGQPWGGPMRISVLERSLQLDELHAQYALDWPLSVPIEDVSIRERDWGTRPYTGVLVEDPADLAALRRLPTQPGFLGGAWYVRGGPDNHYELRVRDAIPLEDEHGSIRLAR